MLMFQQINILSGFLHSGCHFVLDWKYVMNGVGGVTSGCGSHNELQNLTSSHLLLD
jgi:hypothetical protein